MEIRRVFEPGTSPEFAICLRKGQVGREIMSPGTIAPEGEWNNCFKGEEADLMAQLLLGNYSLPTHLSNSNFAFSSTFCPWMVGVGETANNRCSSGETDTYISCYSGGGSSTFSPCLSPQSLQTNNNSITLMDNCNVLVEEDDFLTEELTGDVVQGKSFQLELHNVIPETLKKDKGCWPLDVSKKRSQSHPHPREFMPMKLHKAKTSVSVRSKKDAKNDDNDNGRDLSNTNVSCLDDESNELAAGVGVGVGGVSSKGKTRAVRGSATDSQSLYARKRRERINKRLKILQNLVPNGTKVDISTMLEEAVEYVKFLQLQIKQLLSSDELWMYAPIAYNGMDIGLNK
ncbi:transcription factor bHLH84-like isoform X3 [Andrographis paniculata]|uniref:transcription factor bHLH84-like isoform X3 n=1 Tax=Andrographis paniculata TaxID=175694 RepID=UPI0021E8605A|nr:transcription factor bHLH84-like isoform X3 [Andrographis paniculata]